MKILRGSSHFVRVVQDNQIDFNDLIMGDETEGIYYICVLSWRGQGRSISGIVGLASLTIRAFSVFNIDC